MSVKPAPLPASTTTGGCECSTDIHAIGTPFGIRDRARSSAFMPRGRSSSNRANSRSRIACSRSLGTTSATGSG